ncbi:MAG TPA: RagB/SusD family nutrient uptake outer membrane protein [Candidatus Coprenecus stercoravium]|uniref:RagB/SusD family nutrient uptake outer membrane protein n=1 Tax=Candidatus Coprenecus stercoravium TaxID=2840735 RepID=A0A9D2K8T7_9BACT|nr:RagB/SusD family nutrient uptake outer membrane protein [Candidatus Coprenecus stercoravium]
MAAAFSCTMDLRQPGSIDADNALTSMDDAERLRRGMYVNFRSICAGAFVADAEIQSDLFQPTSSYGNNFGAFFRWDFTSSEAGIESIWASCYSVVASANFLIENLERVLNNTPETFSDDDIDQLNLILGEAYFFRAYCHYELAYRYCKVYDANSAGTVLGVPYVRDYNPTANKDDYPARPYLSETYEGINEDLDLAEQLITTPGQVGSMYLTADVVSAFRARVYLTMKDYQKVIEYASPILSRYTLVNNATDFNNMWVNDSGRETLMMMDASNESNNQATSYDPGYINYQISQENYQPAFIPTQAIVDLFLEWPDDLRTAQFLKYEKAVSNSLSDSVYLFNKFPGNPALFPSGMQSPQSNYLHKNKPFRIAEVYLNLAEAYLESGNTSDAATTLQTLRTARIPGYTSPSYAVSDLRSQIRDERVRELIGEGFRLWDLKRWGADVVRGEEQAPSIMYTHNAMTGTVAYADDFRFVWPIPQTELDTNPNMAGQQNEQY